MAHRILILSGLALAAQTAAAHHSFAPHFDASQPITIAGTIAEFEARNPHAYIHVNVANEGGQRETYICESHGVTQLQRNGIDRARLLPGVAVVLQGVRHRRDPHACFFQAIRIDNGPMLSVNGPANRPVSESRVASDTSRASGIYGTWLLVRRNRSTSGPNPMMDYLTDAGRRAVDAYDPFVDDPTFNCDPVAIRRVWFAPNTPLEIVRDRNRVILRHEWMDVERVVHLNLTEHPVDGERTSLGHSIGRFDDEQLIIETANYSAGVLRQYVEQPDGSMKGLLHSDALHSTETIRFDETSQQLEVTISLEDPVFFTRKFPSATARFARTDLQIQPFGCIPELHD